MPAGPNQNVFNNQGKNALQCIVFSLDIFLFKIEICMWQKKLERDVAMSSKNAMQCVKIQNVATRRQNPYFITSKCHLYFFPPQMKIIYFCLTDLKAHYYFCR